MTSIVLCASQRSGSTMVCEDLRNAGLGRPEEWFLGWLDVATDVGDWRQELTNVNKNGLSDNGIFAVKLMANYLHQVSERLDTLVPVDGDTREFASVFATYHNAVWVFVRRKDKVRQAISQVIAEQTKYFHATANANEECFPGSLLKGYSTDYNRDTVYDFSTIARCVQNIEHGETTWKSFFARFSIEPLAVEYENAAAYPHEYLTRICNAIKIRPPEGVAQRRLVKMANAVNENWYERYQCDTSERATVRDSA